MSTPDDAERRTARDTVSSGAKVTGRGLASAARGTGRFSRYAFRSARRAAAAEGADTSGLARLIELGARNAAADAAVAISLAGTLFFQIPSGEARGQISLFLALTMLPFAIVAPLIGPILDRFSHGRRWAIAATMAVRAFLVWALAGSVDSDSLWLFPAALGVLVGSKAYNVARAAALPRVLPEGLTLVTANARTSMAGMVGVAISAPIAAGFAAIGSAWSLRYAFVVFVVATILAIRLPSRVDSTQGEDNMGFLSGETSENPETTETTETTGSTRARGTVRIPRSMAFALRANCGPRWLSGFLTLFMAFLLRDHPIPGHSAQFSLASRDRRGRARQLPRHRRRIPDETGQPQGHGRARDAGGRRGGDLRRPQSTGCSPSACSASSPGWRSAWPSSRWTRRSSATYPSGCARVPSPAATPPCSWRG